VPLQRMGGCCLVLRESRRVLLARGLPRVYCTLQSVAVEGEMAIRVVGLLSPGDMGHAVGRLLREHDLEVVTCLEGRSERTRKLARQAGLRDVPSLEDVVRTADAVLCILVPSEAPGVARRVAEAIRATGARPLYVDCNAIAPQTVRQIASVIEGVGARFADAGIIGSPPSGGASPRVYASGAGAGEFAELHNFGLDVRVLEGEAGKASGLKMCYGALTKGLQALGTELLVAARAMGLEEPLQAEQQGTLAEVLKYLERSVPTMPPKAYRWVGEMEEIAATFEALALTPRMLLGAADMYQFVAETPIGKESPESRDRARGLDGVVAALAEALQTGNRASAATR